MLPGLLLGAAVLVLLGLPAGRSPVLVPRADRPVWWRTGPAAAGAAGLVALLLSGPVAAAVVVAAVLLLARQRRRRVAAALREAERDGAAEALSVLSAELRAGRSAPSALAAAGGVATGPLADGLQAAAAAGDLGADPVDALLRAAARSAVAELLRGLAACWQVCASTGSSLAAAVDRLAESLQAQEGQRLAVESELAGPRATAGLLAVLPVAGIGLAAGLGAHPLHVLLHTPLGIGCLAAGAVLEWLGLWWTGRLVAAAGGSR